MEVYHGSIEIVKQPEIRDSNRMLDYGKGFYLTTSVDQAADWVKRKLTKGVIEGYVNVYVFDETKLSSLKTIHFKEANEEWLNFVMANRLDPSFVHDFDVVIGPVADDKVYASFALYESGLLDKAELIKELKTYKLIDQILIHTPKCLKYLKWTDFKLIKK